LTIGSSENLADAVRSVLSNIAEKKRIHSCKPVNPVEDLIKTYTDILQQN